MKHYALIGDPVGHSLSPAIYGFLFEKYGIDADFSLIRLPKGRAGDAVCMGLDGFACTMPHKQDIIPFLSALSPDAAAMGSVNIVNLEEHGYIGYSTDGLDFDSAPVPLLFGGNAGFETDVDKSALSDTLPFTVESGKYLIVTFFIPTDAGTKGDLGSSGSTAPGWASSYREGDFVSSVPSTGFTAPSDRALSVSRIQFGTS